jgi:hypothetical protein
MFSPSYLILLIGFAALLRGLIVLSDWVSFRYGRVVPCGKLDHQEALWPQRGELRYLIRRDQEWRGDFGMKRHRS